MHSPVYSHEDVIEDLDMWSQVCHRKVHTGSSGGVLRSTASIGIMIHLLQQPSSKAEDVMLAHFRRQSVWAPYYPSYGLCELTAVSYCIKHVQILPMAPPYSLCFQGD